MPRKKHCRGVHTLCGGEGSPYSTVTLEQISAATQRDEVLQRVQKALSSNQWTNNKEIQPFKRLRDELPTSQGLVLRGLRIVPPESLRESILRSAHQDHEGQGIVRTTQMEREKVWWPGIDHEIETMIKLCLPCQSIQRLHRVCHSHARQTLARHTTGDSLLVCEDACTRWPEVIILKKQRRQ